MNEARKKELLDAAANGVLPQWVEDKILAEEELDEFENQLWALHFDCLQGEIEDYMW